MMAATAVASNYMLIGVANIKFMDLIVFTSGYLMGPMIGAFTGMLIWLIYGTLNPFGFSLPILVATMMGEALYGIAGGFYSPDGETKFVGFNVWAAFTGFIVTTLYDVFTNIVSAYTVGIPISIGLVTGIPFMFAHVLSNTLFFGFGFSPLANSITKILGEKNE